MNLLNHSSIMIATPVQETGYTIRDMSTLAERIIEAMDTAGVSIKQAAEKCEVTYQAIRKLRIGESQSMDGATLVALSELTGYESKWIISGKGPKHRTYAKNESQALALLAMEKMPASEQYKIPEVVHLFTQPKKATN